MPNKSSAPPWVSNLLLPWVTMAQVFEELWPLAEPPDVQWVDDLHKVDGDPWGQTVIPDDGSRPLISIDVATPVDGAVDVFGHELAHVAVESIGCQDDDHGQIWQDCYDAIHAKYVERMTPATFVRS